MTRRSGTKPAGVHPKGQPHKTNLYECFIPVLSERKVYIRKGSGLRVLRIAGAFMAVNLPANPHNYTEVFMEPEEFDAYKKVVQANRRRH